MAITTKGGQGKNKKLQGKQVPVSPFLFYGEGSMEENAILNRKVWFNIEGYLKDVSDIKIIKKKKGDFNYQITYLYKGELKHAYLTHLSPLLHSFLYAMEVFGYPKKFSIS